MSYKFPHFEAVSCPKFSFGNDLLLWETWKMYCQNVIVSLKNSPQLPHNESIEFMQNCIKSFKNDLWFDPICDKPVYLPILLQIVTKKSPKILLPTAVNLLARFMDKGIWNIVLAKAIGFYQPIIKLIKEFKKDMRDDLIFIAAKIYMIEKNFGKVLKKLNITQRLAFHIGNLPENCEKKAIGLFIMCVIFDVSVSKDFQNLNYYISLKKDLLSSSVIVRWWTLILLEKIWRKFPASKITCFDRSVHKDVMNLLSDNSPEVRTAAVMTMSAFIQTESSSDDRDFLALDTALCEKIAKSCNDGSPLVRLLTIESIGQYVIRFKDVLKNIPLRISKKNKLRLLKHKNAIISIIKKTRKDPFNIVSYKALEIYNQIERQSRLAKTKSDTRLERLNMKKGSGIHSIKHNDKFDFYNWSCFYFWEYILMNKNTMLPNLKDILNKNKSHNSYIINFGYYDSNLSNLYNSVVMFSQEKTAEMYRKVIYDLKYNGQERIFSNIPHKCVTFTDAKRDIHILAFHPYEAFLVGVDDHGFINVWDYKNNITNTFANYEIIKPKRSKISGVLFLPQVVKTLVVTSDNGVVTIWKSSHCPNQQRIVSSFMLIPGLKTEGNQTSALYCGWLTGKSQIIFAGSNGKIKWWDPETEKELRSLQLPGESFVSTLFTKVGDGFFYVGTSQGSVYRVNSNIYFRYGIENNSLISNSLFSNEVIKIHMIGRKLIVAGFDSEVLRIDPDTLEKIEVLLTKSRVKMRFLAAHDSAEIFGRAAQGDSFRIFNYSGKKWRTVRQLGALTKSRETTVTAMTFQHHFPLIAIAGKLSKVSIYSNLELGKDIAGSKGIGSDF